MLGRLAMTTTDKELTEVIRAAGSLEYQLWKPFSLIGSHYMEFVNADLIEVRRDRLHDLIGIAKEMRNSIGHFLTLNDIPARFIANVGNRTRESIHNQYLNMTQLYLRFIHAQSKAE